MARTTEAKDCYPRFTSVTLHFSLNRHVRAVPIELGSTEVDSRPQLTDKDTEAHVAG